MTTAQIEPHMTIAQVSDILQLNPKTIRRRIDDGTIRARMIGGAIRIPTSEVARTLREAEARMEEARDRMEKVRRRHPAA